MGTKWRPPEELTPFLGRQQIGGAGRLYLEDLLPTYFLLKDVLRNMPYCLQNMDLVDSTL